MDLRVRAMERLDQERAVRQVAVALDVAPSKAMKWSQRRRRTGSCAPGKPEHLLRNAAGRTAHATWRHSGDLLDQFPPEEYANYFRNSGHASMQSHQVLTSGTRAGRLMQRDTPRHQTRM